MGKVYSYIRFSKKEQGAGSSTARQRKYAEDYARKHGLELDSTLVDDGLSAYHAKHLSKGALGLFLDAIESGQVEPDSTLIIERLDRLSRQKPRQAQALLSQIIDSGITVVTASDGAVYNTQTVDNDPMKLVYSLLIAIRANEESETKSQRSKSAIQHHIKQFQQHKVRSLGGAVPAWFDRYDANKGWEYKLNAKADTIRRIVELSLNGTGAKTIARMLNTEGHQPFGKSANWGMTSVVSVLKNQALFGRRVVNSNGSISLDDYYPAVVSRKDFDAIQYRLNKRKNTKGSEKFVNLITGLGKGFCTCGYCGSAIATQNQTFKTKSGERIVRRMHCTASKESGQCHSSKRIEKVEEAVLMFMLERNLDTLKSGDSQSYEIEIDAIDTKIKKMVSLQLALETSELPDDFMDLLSTLRDRKKELSDKVAKGGIDVELNEQFRQLGEKAMKLENNEARTTVRQIIRDSVANIRIWTCGIELVNEPDVAIEFKNGTRGLISIRGEETIVQVI
ncbi:recombinase family protein [Vibrio europaeus]|uniref:recombinase family protein n=1 Tax=Vibrio europaeus TaxID=300876 RepID=UPI0018A762D1|nr:recombinase family protein [Vibrio europaeus]MDC5812840.1 recombinase family protein [Vibrio europaeus]QPG37634.1 recombinase family protein [Vibrio europaeus]